MTGYVVVYVGEGGLSQYIDHGECQAMLRKQENWDIQIVVPRESIKYEKKENDPHGRIKERVSVKL